MTRSSDSTLGSKLGKIVGPAVDFHLRLLLDKQCLTRNLIEAEGSYDAAKGKAVEQGIDLGDDGRSSGFLSLSSDGYLESEVVEPKAQNKIEVIMNWMKKIVGRCEPTDSGKQQQTDDWDARSVEMNDSVSCHANDSDRRRIDRWQQRGHEHI